MTHRRILLSWSSGKDSAWSLFTLRQDPDNDVVGLLTVINEEFDRVAMHAVRRELLQLQADGAGTDLWAVDIPHNCTNDLYEEAMRHALDRARGAGITAIAFGDLFLEDVRSYRETKMAGMGFELLFPLWGKPTRRLAQEMIDGGLRATVTSIDPRALDRSWAGRAWDAAFLSDLPENVDPCGENGEFHTFVHAGPIFAQPIPVHRGEVVERDGFVFADLLPGRPSLH
ncbi:MAG: ATP-binding protein [bacterium]